MVDRSNRDVPLSADEAACLEELLLDVEGGMVGGVIGSVAEFAISKSFR